jgi:hypothetical protein
VASCLFNAASSSGDDDILMWANIYLYLSSCSLCFISASIFALSNVATTGPLTCGRDVIGTVTSNHKADSVNTARGLVSIRPSEWTTMEFGILGKY